MATSPEAKIQLPPHASTYVDMVMRSTAPQKFIRLLVQEKSLKIHRQNTHFQVGEVEQWQFLRQIIKVCHHSETQHTHYITVLLARCFADIWENWFAEIRCYLVRPDLYVRVITELVLNIRVKWQIWPFNSKWVIEAVKVWLKWSQYFKQQITKNELN